MLDNYNVENKLTVGEEFVNWSEKFWCLKEKYDSSLNDDFGNEESCPYNYMRDIFINKINELIKEKLSI